MGIINLGLKLKRVVLTSRTTLQAQPWNVERVAITGQGIEVFQYAGYYDHNDNDVGRRVLNKDEIAWSLLFKSQSMKDICVRETSKLPVAKANTPVTFVEICFKYEGVPESKDATKLKTEGPEEAEGMYVSGLFTKNLPAPYACSLLEFPSQERLVKLTSVSVGTVMEEGEANEEGQEGEGEEAEEGEKEVDEEAEEGEVEVEDGEVEDFEDIEVEMEDELPAPDQLNLAKLFAEPNEYNDVSPRQPVDR